MSYEDYANHILQKHRLALSLAIIKTKPENITIEEHIRLLKGKMTDDITEADNLSICSNDFLIEETDDIDMNVEEKNDKHVELFVKSNDKDYCIVATEINQMQDFFTKIDTANISDIENEENHVVDETNGEIIDTQNLNDSISILENFDGFENKFNEMNTMNQRSSLGDVMDVLRDIDGNMTITEKVVLNNVSSKPTEEDLTTQIFEGINDTQCFTDTDATQCGSDISEAVLSQNHIYILNREIQTSNPKAEQKTNKRKKITHFEETKVNIKQHASQNVQSNSSTSKAKPKPQNSSRNNKTNPKKRLQNKESNSSNLKTSKHTANIKNICKNVANIFDIKNLDEDEKASASNKTTLNKFKDVQEKSQVVLNYDLTQDYTSKTHYSQSQSINLIEDKYIYGPKINTDEHNKGNVIKKKKADTMVTLDDDDLDKSEHKITETEEINKNYDCVLPKVHLRITSTENTSKKLNKYSKECVHEADIRINTKENILQDSQMTDCITLPNNSQILTQTYESIVQTQNNSNNLCTNNDSLICVTNNVFQAKDIDRGHLVNESLIYAKDKMFFNNDKNLTQENIQFTDDNLLNANNNTLNADRNIKFAYNHLLKANDITQITIENALIANNSLQNTDDSMLISNRNIELPNDILLNTNDNKQYPNDIVMNMNKRQPFQESQITNLSYPIVSQNQIYNVSDQTFGNSQHFDNFGIENYRSVTNDTTLSKSYTVFDNNFDNMLTDQLDTNSNDLLNIEVDNARNKEPNINEYLKNTSSTANQISYANFDNDKTELTKHTTNSEILDLNLATEGRAIPDDSSDIEIDSEIEKIPFKIIEELHKVKMYVNKRQEKNLSGKYSNDTGYRSDSSSKNSLKLSQSYSGLDQSAHSLCSYIRECPLVPTTINITEEISMVLGQLIDKLHDEEIYPSFLEDIFQTIRRMLELICQHNSDECVLSNKDEYIHRIILLSKSIHIQKYTIENITHTLETFHSNITSNESFETQNIEDIENTCYIFHLLEIILQKYNKSQNAQNSSQTAQNSSQTTQNLSQTTQCSSQNTQEDEKSLKKSQIMDIWRKKWNPNYKEDLIEGSQEKINVISRCNAVLNKLIVGCMEGYSLISYFALKCFNVTQI